jgi:hypothetical protein
MVQTGAKGSMRIFWEIAGSARENGSRVPVQPEVAQSLAGVKTIRSRGLNLTSLFMLPEAAMISASFFNAALFFA